MSVALCLSVSSLLPICFPSLARIFASVGETFVVLGDSFLGLMARTNTVAGGRRQNKNAASGVAKNKVNPAVKLTDMRAGMGRRMSVASAVIGEKMTHFRANLSLGFYRIIHPVHPVRRVAAQEATKEMKAAATGNEFLTPEFQTFLLSEFLRGGGRVDDFPVILCARKVYLISDSIWPVLALLFSCGWIQRGRDKRWPAQVTLHPGSVLQPVSAVP